MKKIITAVVLFLILGIWGVCIYHTNRVCRDRYHEVTIPDGRLELNGLRYEVETGILYDTEALLAAYPDLYTNADSYRMSDRLGKEYQLVAKMKVTNISGEEMDVSAIPNIDNIQSGAWTNGTDLLLSQLSPMYADDKEKLLPGESTTVLLATNLLAIYIKSMELQDLYNRTFYAVLTSDDGVQCDHYYLAFRPDDYIQATDADMKAFTSAVAETEKRRQQQESEYAENEGDDMPEDTTAPVTKMGEEFIRDGIGYTVVKAQMSNDVTKLDADQDPAKWQYGVLPSIKNEPATLHKDVCYTYVEIEIHNYHKKSHTLFYESNSDFYCCVGSELVSWDGDAEGEYFESELDTSYQVYCVDLTNGTVSDYESIPMEIEGGATALFGICYCSGTSTERDEWILRPDPNLMIMADAMKESYPIMLLDRMEVR